MKYFLTFIGVGILCGSAYIRNEQPHNWNAFLDFLKAAEPKPLVVTAQPDKPTSMPDAVVAATVAAPTPPSPPSPDATVAAPISPALSSRDAPVTTPTSQTPPPSPDAATANVVTAQQTSTGPLTFIPPHPLPAQANWTWTATGGKVYKNVVITKVEADCVTVIDDEGGARIDIATLPPDIQKLLNYDPATAKIVADARAEEEAKDKATLASERQQEQQQLKVQAATDQKTNAPSTLTQADRDAMQQKILDLQSDIRRKLREIAQSWAQDGFRRGTSHTAFEDIIAQEAQQVNALQAKLGVRQTPAPIYYIRYPYYYYP
jgi:hypothetical protein